MSKKTKKFKIGERAIGGIIQITVDSTEQEVNAKCLDWHTGKLVDYFYDENTDDLDYLERLLNDWTDCYHTEQILCWVAKNGFNEASEHYIYGRS